MRIGETLKKAAGLFVEIPESEVSSDFPTDPTADPVPQARTRTVEEVVKEAPGPNLDEIKVPVEAAVPAEPVIGSDGHVNFAVIYGLAKLPTTAFTAEQVLEVLASMPPELPLETKRATLRVTLQTMSKTLGVTADSIVADASRKLAALAAYSESFSKQAEEFTSTTQHEIAMLELQIEAKKKSISEASAKQTLMTDACANEADRLDEVLEFFSLDVPPSKHASAQAAPQA